MTSEIMARIEAVLPDGWALGVRLINFNGTGQKAIAKRFGCFELWIDLPSGAISKYKLTFATACI